MSFDASSLGDLYPFTPKRLRLEGGHELSYVDEGPRDAPVLLMVHGNPTWSFYYRDVVKTFRDRFRCVVPDHIGAGLSDKPQDYSYTLATHIENLHTLTSHLGLGGQSRTPSPLAGPQRRRLRSSEVTMPALLDAPPALPATPTPHREAEAIPDRPPADVSLIVHDWGGAIGMGWALRNEGLVKRTVILNTSAFRSKRIPFSINICRIPGLGALAIRGMNAFARAAVIRAARTRLAPEVVRGYLGPYDSWANRIANLRFVQDIPLHAGVPSWSVMEEIEAGLPRLADRPMLICWGGEDFCFDDSFLEGWRTRFPQAEVHRFAEAGHYILEDAGAQVIEHIGAFLPVAERVPEVPAA